MTAVSPASVPVLAGVPGQERAVALLAASLANPVHAYLLVGPHGCGKRETARAFAAALVCRQGGCGACRDCRLALAGDHPDVREVERVGPFITAEQADAIVRLASRSPTEAARKVLVLTDFHLVNPAAVPKLLKTIEEPSASTVFLVLADDVPPDLVTIASRCLRVDFGPLAPAVIEARLIAEGVDRAAAERAAAAASGDLDRARVLALDPALVERRAAFASVASRLDGSGAAAVREAAALLAMIDEAAGPMKARHAVEEAELAARVERLGERGSGRKELEERHRRELRRHRTDELRAGLGALAATYHRRLVEGTDRHPDDLVAAIRTIHEAIDALDRNPNEALLLQALLLRLPPR